MSLGICLLRLLTKPFELRLSIMKINSILYLICLVAQTSAHSSSDANTSRNRRIHGSSISDNTDHGRKIRVIPTLLKKFLEGRRKFGTFDGILGDVLFGMAPSDSPSMTPSDSPSSQPSDSPSASPTAVPSAAPFSWNDVIGNDNINFKSCTSDPKPLNDTATTELTILFSYKLELQEKAHVFKTLEKIEEMMEEKLIEEMCNTPFNIVGVSSSPSDIPGASCRSSPDKVAEGPCYVIAGRFQLLVGIDSIADANSMYCKFLEATRAYIASDAVPEQISDVTNIRSTMEGSLVPKFCSYRNAELSASESTSGGASTTDSKKTAKYIVPVTLGMFALVVVVSTILLFTRYRNIVKDTPIENNLSNSESDLEFQNSDETDDFEIDPTTMMVTEQHDKNTKSNTPPNKIAHFAVSEERGVAFNSPAPTEQEIVFTPSSSVATSVLFRSP